MVFFNLNKLKGSLGLRSLKLLPKDEGSNGQKSGRRSTCGLRSVRPKKTQIINQMRFNRTQHFRSRTMKGKK